MISIWLTQLLILTNCNFWDFWEISESDLFNPNQGAHTYKSTSINSTIQKSNENKKIPWHFEMKSCLKKYFAVKNEKKMF